MKYLKVWTSFREVIKPLSEAEKGRLFDIMLKYAEDHKAPDEMPGNERFVWPAAQQQIDLTMARAETLRQNGLKGGRPANQEKAKESKEKQNEPDETCNVKKSNVMESNTKEKEVNNNIRPLKRFIPPTVDEVKAYCDSRSVYLIDPQRFIDYYESRGWMLTNNRKMVDWKAAVRLWEKNEKERQDKERTANYDLPY